MSKMTKVIAALGVVAGLGAAAMPLSSYAADSVSATVDVYATVESSLSIEASKERIDLNVVKDGGIAKASTIITVNTSDDSGYTLKIKDSDDETALVKLTDGVVAPNEENKIAAGTLTGDESSWGYALDNSDTFTAVTTTGETIDSTEDAGEGSVTVTFGVRIAGEQAAGTYKGGVIFTATTNS